MRLDVTKCDVCPCSVPANEANAQGWLNFSYVFADMDGLRAYDRFKADLCPACVDRMTARLRLALNHVGRASDSGLESLETIEAEHILSVLNAVDWVKSRAARILGIERSTLDRKIRQHGMTPPSTTKTSGPKPKLVTT